MKDIDWSLIKILVVDDDATTRKMLEKFVKTIGCTVACAENGLEALEFAKKYRFDMCIMDLMMPQMGGIEAALIINEEIDSVLPIIALTSSSLKSDKEKCEDIGMKDFINKPVSIKEVKGIIAEYAVTA